MSFEPNVGQTNNRVKFLARGAGYSVFMTQDGVTLTLSSTNPAKREKARGQANPTTDVATEVLKLRFVGSLSDAVIAAERELPGRSNYLLGSDPSKWIRDVPTFEAVRYRSVYPGIDALLYGNREQLEYDFEVAPGADPSQIRLRFEGHESISVADDGSLKIRMAGGEVRQQRALVYQNGSTGKREIEAAYTLSANDEVGFALGAYDPRVPLVIDPVLVYAAYLGSSNASDEAHRIVVDSTGCAYVMGSTNAVNFPVSPGAASHPGGDAAEGTDIFLCKIAADGSSLVYSIVLGGAESEAPGGIAIDSEGSAFISGSTGSSDFPTTPGAYDRINNDGSDGFVAKLSPSGQSVLFATLLGGGASDQCTSIAIDGSGMAVVGGITGSLLPEEMDFPTTPGAYDRTFNGFEDGFVSKFSANGSALVFSTFVGGSSNDYVQAIALDPSGSICAAGRTDSVGFPTTAGAFDRTLDEPRTSFVQKFSAGGSSLQSSTFLGAIAEYSAVDIAVDPVGSVFVAGNTGSAAFPTTPGAFSTTLTGGGDIFVAKLSSSLGSLHYSTFVGGAGGEVCYGIAIDLSGAAYLTGNCANGFPHFPTTPGAFDVERNGESDAFVTKINATGSALVFSTYLGGDYRDNGADIAVDQAGSVYVAGQTPQSSFPGSSAALAGGLDISNVFVTKFNPTGTALSYSARFGGTYGPGEFLQTGDGAEAVATDASGAVYVAGDTLTANFPITAGAYDGTVNGVLYDAYITKLSADGQTLIYSTFLGGDFSTDFAIAIAVDASGAAYVTGTTAFGVGGLPPDFPITPGVFGEERGNVADAFITKLSPDGSALVYSTFLGGQATERPSGIVVEPDGEVVLVGEVSGSDIAFPTTPGAFDTTYGGNGDCFVTKINADASSLVYSTFLGGSSRDYASAIASSPDGSVYVTGVTSAGFPTTSGAFDTTPNGGFESFVTQLNAEGSGLIYSTLIGGAFADTATGIAVDDEGSALIVGFTSGSNGSAADYPVTPGAYDVSLETSDFQGFVTKFSSDGSSLVYSTYLNGTKPSEVQLGSTGAAYIAGDVIGGIPITPDALDTVRAGGEGFVALLDPTGSALLYSSFLGGAGFETVTGASLVNSATLIVVGSVGSGSEDFLDDGFGTYDGGSAFVARIDFGPASGSDTVGVYSGGSSIWYLRNGNDGGPAHYQFGYGPTGLGWIALRGDWDGDGDDTAGLYNPSNGVFFLRNSNEGGPANLQFGYGPGGLGWIPLSGDWDGDGDDSIGLYDPSTGIFYLRNTNDGGPANLQFGYGPGGLGWRPLVGDWNGIGGDSVGVYEPATGVFYLRNSNDGGPAHLQFGYGPGGLGWLPLSGDWDGDGIDTVALYNPSNGVFYLRGQNAGGPADSQFQYGPLGITPLTGDWDGQ